MNWAIVNGLKDANGAPNPILETSTALECEIAYSPRGPQMDCGDGASVLLDVLAVMARAQHDARGRDAGEPDASGMRYA